MKSSESDFPASEALKQIETRLSPQTVLRRLSELKLHLTSDNQLQIDLPDRMITCGSHGLAILDQFATPIALCDAVKQLRQDVTGGQDCVDQWHTILQLYKAGVLQDVSRVEPALPVESSGFDSLDLHIRMLDDHTRTAQYIAAIKETVRPGDIAVDIGTGTGILAMAAAKAGARHVYAVEAGRIGQTAHALFAANGLSERITLLSGWSTQLNLPERADVLISEIIGDEPLGERVLEVTADAKQRLLKADARLLPQILEIYGRAVCIPETELKKHTVRTDSLHNWAELYGIDFGPLAEIAARQSMIFSVWPSKASCWLKLSPPIQLAEVDFHAEVPLVIDQHTKFTINTKGRFNGFILYFNLILSPTRRLTSNPAIAPSECNWRNRVWLLPESFQAAEGDEFRVTYCHGVAGKDRLKVARA